MKTIRVLIADDSVVYRSQIRAALSNLPWIEVVGSVPNGRIAVDKIQQTKVDLLILDLEMPEMDGLQTLQAITAKGLKCKVLVFSSVSKRGAEITLEALRCGADDFITKPGAGEDKSVTLDSNPSIKIRSVLEPKIVSLFPSLDLGITTVVQGDSTPRYANVIWDLFNPKVIVIGSSTGGPTVLEKIFSEISLPLRCPIFITQHMPPIFTAALAERLQKISGIPTVEAKNGMVVQMNTIYLAPGNYHMSLAGTKDNLTIVLDQGPMLNSVRPAVDPLFNSAASIFGNKTLGIVLTGMGADGNDGAKKIKSVGGAVLIQSEQTCVVFGMPGAVKASGAYDKILSPAEIISALVEKATGIKIVQTKKMAIGE